MSLSNILDIIRPFFPTHKSWWIKLAVFTIILFILGRVVPLYYGDILPVVPIEGEPHPVEVLVSHNIKQFNASLAKQSDTLKKAVLEYRRRYGIAPPPHFDTWFEFARLHKVRMIDDYDTIHDDLLPFWGLKPSTIRERVSRTFAHEPNRLAGIKIRNGVVLNYEGDAEGNWASHDFERSGFGNMTERFIHLLPDMNIAMNPHDEPRVAVPYEKLNELVELGKTEKSLHAATSDTFTPDIDPDMEGRGKDTIEFIVGDHQKSWPICRLSCSPDSPASQNIAVDDVSWTVGDLSFVGDWRTSSDMCKIPSSQTLYAFAARPNSFSYVHDLIPVFSPAKPSAFQDILMPQPWNWNNMTKNEGADPTWSKKSNTLYWTGSGTGGYSKNGEWRYFHRQRIVRELSSAFATIMVRSGRGWSLKSMLRSKLAYKVYLYFTRLDDDAEDMEQERKSLSLVELEPFETAFRNKYLLDMDGYGFSGRFYSMLLSNSLPIKMSMLREWQQDWVKPWVHYVPLSLNATEGSELLHYFTGEGEDIAQMLARQGREWSQTSLRKIDMEAYLFRLMLE